MADNRDLRDPEQLGNLLLEERERMSAGRLHKTFHSIADSLGRFRVDDYSHTESLCAVTAREYQEKQVALAEEGVLESARLCDERGWAYIEHPTEDRATADEDSQAHEGTTVGHVCDEGGWEEIRKAPPVEERRCHDISAHAAHGWMRYQGQETLVYYCPGN